MSSAFIAYGAELFYRNGAFSMLLVICAFCIEPASSELA
jgi:hypothetical protein